MEDNLKKVEAVLFAVGKEITLERLAALCSMELKEVKKLLGQLKKEYHSRNHSLQITEQENGWKLTVRDQFIPLVSSIVTSMEMERPLMETLAVIAWKYPVVQSEIIKLRGVKAYEHMSELVARGFISKEKFARTYKVKLTNKFFNYFDLPSEEAKQAFLKQVPKQVLQEAEDVNKEADEVERLIELEGRKEGAKSEIKEAVKGLHEESEK